MYCFERNDTTSAAGAAALARSLSAPLAAYSSTSRPWVVRSSSRRLADRSSFGPINIHSNRLASSAAPTAPWLHFQYRAADGASYCDSLITAGGLCSSGQTLDPSPAIVKEVRHQGASMIRLRTLAIATVALMCLIQPLAAQDLSRYRDYMLESSLGAVVAASGTRLVDVRLVRERPARIQELQWRAPYVSTGSEDVDPVREIVFAFYDDRLYQIVVNYDRDRTEGLTNADVIASVSTMYGKAVTTAIRLPASSTSTLADTVALARWDDPMSTITLVRGTYSPTLQLIMVSKSLQPLALRAIRESIRLDALDEPRRELEQRKKAADDAIDAREKVRSINKGAFRP
jgi:hypothetical protein